MIEDFRLPQLGEGLTESELVQWHVAVGDTVALNQTIAEVETAKAVVELPSPFAGVVSALHAEPGATVNVGAVLISFELGGGEVAPVAPSVATAITAAAAATPAAEGEGRAANLVGYGAAPTPLGRPARRARRASAERAAARGAETAVLENAVLEAAPHDALTEMPATTHGDAGAEERPRSTPPVRKFARDLGVDLAGITGTGVHGLVTREDVAGFVVGRPGEAAAVVKDEASTLHAPHEARITRIPIRGVRKLTAAAMVSSAFTAPHVTSFLTIDVTPTMELVASLRDDKAFAEHRIGVLAVVAKAVCLALGRTPSVNAKWDEPAGEILQHHYVNLGIAAATDRGLVVPNVKDAERMTLLELADALSALSGTAREGRTQPADMTGGTFTITNIGVLGMDGGTPIINPGEAGILAMGAVRRQPWEYRGEIALRDVMTLSLSFDHRLVDGEQGAKFLMDVAAVLREPGRAMLMR